MKWSFSHKTARVVVFLFQFLCFLFFPFFSVPSNRGVRKMLFVLLALHVVSLICTVVVLCVFMSCVPLKRMEYFFQFVGQLSYFLTLVIFVIGLIFITPNDDETGSNYSRLPWLLVAGSAVSNLFTDCSLVVDAWSEPCSMFPVAVLGTSCDFFIVLMGFFIMFRLRRRFAR